MSVIRIGMDVHKNSFTLAAYDAEKDDIAYVRKTAPTAKAVKEYLDALRNDIYGDDAEFECGYEAGCLGFALQRDLESKQVPCVILAPTTMAATPTQKKKKTDSRDAETIARCLANNTYSAVHIPTPEDEAVRDFIRMRGDHLADLQRMKHRIVAFCTRKGHSFTDGKTYWTKKHLEWLRKVELSELDRETLNEYLMQLDQLMEKISRLDKRIDELAASEPYAEATSKLQCFLGIKAHTALAFVAEVGDFSRFQEASNFASWLGLVPGECSSGDKTRRTGITKAGNTHLRKLLIEVSYSYMHGAIGHKSVELKKRQEGCDPKVIAYADRCNLRLRRKAWRMRNRDKTANVIKTACARELACFIWGMMRNEIEVAA